jgi:hypothetical protein
MERQKIADALIDQPGEPESSNRCRDHRTGAGRSNQPFRCMARRQTMNLEYVPLVRVMREIQSIPRGQPPDFNGKKRFRHYLRTIFDYDRKICKLPLLLAMNPMGKDHVTALLDAYVAMDADGIGARVAAEAGARLADVPGDFKIGLVVCHDLMGGGTNRYDIEFAFRFGGGHLSSVRSWRERPRWL